MIEYVETRGGELLATIISSGVSENGINFVTNNDSEHQVGILQWPQGHIIEAHVHNSLSRTINSTQEVLFVRWGRVRVDLYTSDRTYDCSRILESGDVVFLESGGHGFEILEAAQIIEVKQGPYIGDHEKTKFAPLDNPHLKEPHAER